jgi:predicted RNase H-like nuclease (RuvC/YqgF family)
VLSNEVQTLRKETVISTQKAEEFRATIRRLQAEAGKVDKLQVETVSLGEQVRELKREIAIWKATTDRLKAQLPAPAVVSTAPAVPSKKAVKKALA